MRQRVTTAVPAFLLLGTFVLAGTTPTPVAAQVDCGSMAECQATTFAETGVQQELAFVGVNALLGGLTAAAVQWFRGDPVTEAFLVGAVGGGVTYAGKRVAVDDFYGAGLLGRELASVGGSMVRNASAGRGPLDELVLPVGPVRLYISGDRVVPRVDLGTLITAGAFMLTYDARLDVASSISSGAMVFRGETPMPGLSSAGAMVVWSDMPASEGPRLMAHERVHVLQYDQAYLAWGEALERWGGRQMGTSVGGMLDHLDVGVTALGLRSGLGLAFDYHSRPWETEAYFLAQRSFPIGPAGGN